MIVLIANIGSTSFKYRLFDMETESVLAEGKAERIGQPGTDFPDYESAIRRCMNEIAGEGKILADLDAVSAVGFKAVHAGPLSGARLIDENVLAAMEEFSFFAPAHNPPYIAAMRAFQRELPNVPLVALFETAFFDSLSQAVTAYGLPSSWREQYGIRRYGFHGASHRSASERVSRLLGRSDLRHVSCHLGGSSSVAAIRSGVAVDVSFGISPQSGLPQSNRVGDVDSFVVLFMMKKLGLQPDEMASVLSSQAGLAGISGLSGDVRDLEQAASEGNAEAQLALDVFVRSVRHYIGAFFVELGGLDVLTFSGGIGENSATIRRRVCEGLSVLGIEIEENWNRSILRRGTISTNTSPVKVVVLPADEEIIVARETVAAITGKQEANVTAKAVSQGSL
jgi:acetate kinase